MKTFAAMAALMYLTLIPALASAQTMVILTRHAERADGAATMGAASGGANDPELSAAGKDRAERLAALLAEAGVGAIFTTEYRRTQDTAAPLAARTALQPEIVPAAQLAALVGKIKGRAHDTVLVVGHSNTVPAIIKALGGPDVTIGDAEYGTLFIWVPATGTLTRLRY